MIKDSITKDSIVEITGFAFNNITKLCGLCQQNIEGYHGLNCPSCKNSGPGKCDADMCPAPGLTYYNKTTQMCEEEKRHKPCKQ